jgi:hypothetical protein
LIRRARHLSGAASDFRARARDISAPLPSFLAVMGEMSIRRGQKLQRIPDLRVPPRDFPAPPSALSRRGHEMPRRSRRFRSAAPKLNLSRHEFHLQARRLELPTRDFPMQVRQLNPRGRELPRRARHVSPRRGHFAASAFALPPPARQFLASLRLRSRAAAFHQVRARAHAMRARAHAP